LRLPGAATIFWHGACDPARPRIFVPALRRAGIVEIRAGVSEITPRYRPVVHWGLSPESGRPWGVATSIGIAFDLETRKSISLSPEELSAAQRFVREGLSL
jgi:hypothetical protein